ncbi:MAG: SDR family oxidoreductase [Nocardioides sp.]
MPDPSYDFAGRHVLVTGGTRGLGLNLAHAFADAGARVTVTGTQYLRAWYDADLSRFGYDQLELTDRDSIAAVASRVDRLDVLVNNAPPQLPASVDTNEQQFLAHAARLGLVGPLAFGSRLRFRLGESTQRGGGTVVNAPGARSWFELDGSTQGRAELARMTSRLATDWARSNVRVNSVDARLVLAQQSGLRVQIDRSSGPLLTRTQAPRAGTARDVRNLVMFLASTGAAGVTGQTFDVNARREAGI